MKLPANCSLAWQPSRPAGPPCALLCSARAPQEGARLQLQQGQLNCGLELCMLLVEAYVTDRLAPSEEAVQRVASLVDAFPRQARPPAEEPPIHECAKFVAAAVKWLRG